MIINHEYEKNMDKAIEYLALAIHNSGKNTKPVLLHSTRVGLYLHKEGYEENVIIAGILHDILEDTDTNINELQELFGNEIANLVKVNTFDTSIQNKTERYKNMFRKCIEKGKDSVIIKAADILDNCNYIELVKEEKLKSWLIGKLRYFINISYAVIGQEQVWNELKKKYDSIV